MKRLFILFILLVLLAGCGRAAQAPEEPTTDEVTTIVTTTEAPITTEPQTPTALPFTKDDITAIEAQFKTVGDYVKAVPAAWYEIVCWNMVEDAVRIRFYDHKPGGSEYRPSLEIVIGFVESYSRAEETVLKITQVVPEDLLAETASIEYINFAKTGEAITPLRGIKIGDNAQKIFDEYPDYRIGNSKVLYDITTLYPEANLEWGKWDGEGWSNIDFLGGGLMEGGVGYTFVEPPWGWDDRENDYTWLNMYNPRYLLTYQATNAVITGIEFMLLYHPG